MIDPAEGSPREGVAGPASGAAPEPLLRIVGIRNTLPRGVVIRSDRFEGVELAERAVTAARQEAAAIRAAAMEDARELREAARREGLEEGRRALAAAEVALRAEAVQLRAEAGDRLLRLAVTLAERVVGAELRARPEALLALVRKTVAQVAFCRRAVVRLHPEDERRLAEAYPALSATVAGGAELRLEADPGLAPGDCLVETDGGRVDGSVRVLLASLEETLLAGSPILSPGPAEEPTP